MTQKGQTPEINGRWWALAALALSMLTLGLDATVLNVALPTLATELDASTSQLQWFGASYTLVLGALMHPDGQLSATASAANACCWPAWRSSAPPRRPARSLTPPAC